MALVDWQATFRARTGSSQLLSAVVTQQQAASVALAPAETLAHSSGDSSVQQPSPVSAVDTAAECALHPTRSAGPGTRARTNSAAQSDNTRATIRDWP